jgi:hypothetical protein
LAHGHGFVLRLHERVAARVAYIVIVGQSAKAAARTSGG